MVTLSADLHGIGSTTVNVDVAERRSAITLRPVSRGQTTSIASLATHCLGCLYLPTATYHENALLRVLPCCPVLVPLFSSAAFAAESGSCVVQAGSRLELHSPFFVFTLDTADGLHAVTWENRLTGKTVSLGRGSELDVDLGPLDGPHQTPTWQTDVRLSDIAENGSQARA